MAFVQIPILMYHEIAVVKDREKISAITTEPYVLEVNKFESQMQFLYNNNYKAVSLYQVVNAIDNGNFDELVDKKHVVLTFDDGFIGNYLYVFPLLKKYNFNATFFIIVDKVGSNFMMTWEMLSEMGNNGMLIESHTMSHNLLNELDVKEIENELHDSKKRIENKINKKVEFLSLPHGSAHKNLKQVLQKFGYRGSCCSDFGFVHSQSNKYFLPRITIKDSLAYQDFQKIIQQDKVFINKNSSIYNIKKTIRSIVGDSTYNKIYQKVYSKR